MFVILVLAPILGCLLLAFAIGMAIGHLLRTDRQMLWTAGVISALSVLLIAGPFWT